MRAGLAMRDELAELNRELAVELAARVGINSGEAVAETSTASQFLVTGDVVNVAARIQQGADVGEVVVGVLTEQLTRVAIEYRPHEPIVAKGKDDAARSIHRRACEERIRRTPVGSGDASSARRPRPRAEASPDTIERAKAERAVHVFTLLGEPGVGKSRLVGEVLARLRDESVLLRGRCLPYGAGITFWPMTEIVRQAAGLLDEHSPDEARARIIELAGDVAVGQRVAQAIGVTAGASSADETSWAIRRLLGEVARHRACLLVIDDVQWAEEALLEVLAGLPDRLDDAPMLALLLGRPEFVKSHADWPSVISLETLGDEAAMDLATRLTGERELAGEVVARAGGNPLYLEELAALLAEDGVSDVLPATLNALLVARLDHLGEDERSALEQGAVEGEVFHRGAVAELADDRRVVETLPGLRETGVLRPARAAFVGEAAFAFRHILLRDAAYSGLTKRSRVVLHERVAGWLERVAGARVNEYEEIVGYHLERAYRYLEELGPVDEHGRRLAARAADRLFAAGRRAASRGDATAARNLFTRAVSLIPPDAPSRPERLGVARKRAVFGRRL